MNDSPYRRLLDQLKERKVIRAAVTYVIVAWVILQVGEVVFDGLQLPAWSLNLLIALVVLGFPVAMVLSWAFDLTATGLRRESAAQTRDALFEPDVPAGARSIAVLPFNDMSEKGNQAHFCEGIAEEILNALRTVDDLRVASRMAAFQFGGTGADVTEIGRKLKVGAILEGSVRTSENRLRITAQLVDTVDGHDLWSRQFDRELKNVFEIQEEISRAIADALGVSRHRRSWISHPVDPKAYDFFLRGLSYFARHTTQDTVYARQMFDRAIEIEPEYGRAWAGMAYTYGFEYMYFNATDVNREEARRTSQKALRLAPDLAESHVSAGIAHCMAGEYRAAEAEFERAIELDPKNYEAWYFFGRSKVHEGQLRRALELFERAATVRPEDYQSVLLQAQLYTSLRRKDKAVEVTRVGVARVRAFLELNPDDNRALNMGAFGLLRLGKKREAMKWMETSMENAPNDSITQYNAACFFSLAGEIDRALDCLENCLVKVGNISREWLIHDSDMDNIRRHPRFSEIMTRFPD